MKKPIARNKFFSIALRLCVILCLCLAVTIISQAPMQATAAGTKAMITIEMMDSYGDGWSDNAIEIFADGELLGTATMDDGASATWTAPIDPHVDYEFRWVSGTYAQETDFVIYIGTEAKVSASGFAYAGGELILSVKQSCSGPNYSAGVCVDCGASCVHLYVGKDGTCADCGYACKGHSWVNGVCSVCSGACLHQAYQDGACNVCGAKMTLTIEMTDAYSDGWNGNAIKIYADGVLLDTATINIGYNAQWTTEYNSNATYTFEWVKGSYSDECSFRILLVGQVCYEAKTDNCAELDAGVFYTLKPWCGHEQFDSDFCCTNCGEPCAHSDLQPKGTCSKCGFSCGTSAPHSWLHNTCQVCGLTCAHVSWTNSVCNNCGFFCGVDAKHNFDQSNTCTVCGFACGSTVDHAWNLGNCGTCGMTCEHSKWTNYVCDDCGMACGSDVNHNFDSNHNCSTCGFVCGTSAAHTWKEGNCTTCGINCGHTTYINGVCTFCGDYESAVRNGVGENGFALYEIHNAGQLLWFARYVNSNQVLLTTKVQGADADDTFFFEYTSGCVNAKLMADIDMTGFGWTPIGVPYSTHTASRNSYGYAGVFDGNGHAVSNIQCNAEADDNTVYAGFIGAMGGGTIKNLTVKGNIQGIVKTDYYPAAYVGGIVGYACEWFDYPTQNAQERQMINSLVINCTFIGNVSAEAADQEYVGGIAGMASGTSITNCLAAVKVSATGAAEYHIGSVCGYVINDCAITNCWYDSDLCNAGEVAGADHAGVTGMSTQRWELGFGAQVLGFGQTLGTDIYPSYGDDPVYQVTTGCITFSNTPADKVAQKAHEGAATCIQQAKCEACGEVYIDHDNHNYSSKVTTAATCTSNGVRTYTCGNCSHSYTESIAANGHNYVGGKCGNCGDTKVVSINGTFNNWAGDNMTWTSNGYTFNIVLSAGSYEFKIVKDGTWMGNNGTIEDTTVKTSDIGWEFVGNDGYGNCTLVATGGTYTFTFNFDSNMLVITYDHTHAYVAGEVVAPTCTAKGYTVYACSCGGTENRDEKAALGHNHVGKVTTAATCTKDGVKTYTCSRCSDSYTEVITKLGHDYKATVTKPTCNAQGYTTHTCSRCSDSYVDTYVSATGHSWNSTTGSCNNCGTSCDHKWNAGTVTKQPTCTATGTKSFTCTVCGDGKTETIAATGHSYTSKVTAPTCTAQGYTTYTCSKCNDSYKDNYKAALGHNYSSKVTTAATCTTDGVKTYTCGNCSHSYTESIPAIGHNYVGGKCGNCGDTKVVSVNGTFNDWAGNNMTWTSNGYTFNIVLSAGSYEFKIVKDGTWMGNNGTIEDTTVKTSDIGWEFVGNDGYGNCTLVATGGTYTFTFNFDTNMLVIEYVHTHAYTAGTVVAPTCTAKGYTVYTCPCGGTENRDETAALGHSWNDGVITTKPTCTDKGIKTFTCTACGETKTEDVAATGHSYTSKVTDPTCTAEGYTTYTCACGDSYVADKVAALGHAYKAIVTAPTCTAGGYTTHTCSRCSDSYKDTYKDALGHNYQNGACQNCGDGCPHNYTSKVTKDPTCTTEGVRTYTCSICSGSYTESIAKLGHSYTSKVTDPTCTAEGYTTYTCATCGDTYKDNYTSALGHSYTSKVTTAATCTTDGVKTYTCGNCNHSYTESIPATGHNYQTEIVAPGCMTDGYTIHVCSGCGNFYKEAYTYATGHSWQEATCTEPMHCSVCGISRGEALEHLYKAEVIKATCSAAGYTTYTCSVCGDSYVGDEVAATGAHNYTYAFVNNQHTLTCSICGDVISAAGTNELKFRNATLSLASDISVIFKLDIDDVFEVGYMVFEVNGEETYVYDWTIDESNGRKVFAYQGINPQMMGDSINCTMHVYLDGTEVTVSYAGYSVKKYCENQFKKTDATVKQVCANLLNYGAAVQLKKGYKTDALVNANLPVAPETFPGVGAITNQQAMSGAAIGTTDIKSVALQLSNKVEIKVGMVLDNPADYVIKATIKGNEFTYGESDLVYDESNGRYYLYFSNLNARDFDETITFVILKDGVEVSRTLTYSVNSYIAKNGGADTADGNTLRALYCYGKSTESLSN